MDFICPGLVHLSILLLSLNDKLVINNDLNIELYGLDLECLNFAWVLSFHGSCTGLRLDSVSDLKRLVLVTSGLSHTVSVIVLSAVN